MSDRVVAVVLAGGSGTRMGTDANKVYLDLAGLPILAYSLRGLSGCDVVTDVVLVARPADGPSIGDAIARSGTTKLRCTVAGGTSRQGSEIGGLTAVRELPGIAGDDIVLLHDGARPFVSVALVDALVAGARRYGGAIPGLRVEGAVHRVAGDSLDRVDTAGLWRVQTPQAFALAPLLAAYDAAATTGFDGVDTADTVQHHLPTQAVTMVPGDPRNLKVTTPADLVTASGLAARWQHGTWLDGPAPAAAGPG